MNVQFLYNMEFNYTFRSETILYISQQNYKEKVKY